jgi:hypothetical protein
MKTIIFARREGQSAAASLTRRFEPSPAALIRIPAMFGLLLCSQAAWAALSASPSPSFDGSYMVSWGYPLGCTVYDVYGFPTEYCYHMEEYQGTISASNRTDVVASGASKSYSDKRSGTYTYVIWANWSGFWGTGSGMAEGPLYVEVIRPLPILNVSYIGGPQQYVFKWNAENADPNRCDLDLRWWVSGQSGHVRRETLRNLPTNHEVVISKIFTNTSQIRAELTCHGPGGATTEPWWLTFV